MQLLDLLRRQRRSARRDDGETGLEDLTEVKVTLDQNPKSFLTYGRLGEIQAIQGPPLGVDRGLGRVQVLGLLV